MDLPAIVETVARTCRALGWDDLELVAVFGSAVSGRLTPESDVDVLVRLDRGAPLDVSRRHRLESALSSALGREVDVVVDGPRTSVVLRREIARKGVPVHERFVGAFKHFVVAAIRDYVDLAPQLQILSAAARARALREGGEALARFEARNGR